MSEAINEVGKRYGKLVVIERAGNSKGGQAMWLCQCDCGRKAVVWGANLRRGKSTSCGRCTGGGSSRPLSPDELRKLAVHYNKGTKPYKHYMKLADEREEKNKTGAYRKETLGMYSRTQYPHMRECAEKRKLPFDLSYEEYKHLITQPCSYCEGKDLRTYCSTLIKVNGIDRFNNDKKAGYTIDNVVPCCGQCNMQKHNRSIYEFITVCARVADVSVSQVRDKIVEHMKKAGVHESIIKHLEDWNPEE